MEIKEGLTFDDVLLVPQFSEVASRSSVDTSVKLAKKFKFKHPIIPANMKTVTDAKMAKCIADSGGLAIVHRFMSLEDQLDIVNEFVLMTEERTPDYAMHVGYSVGVKKENYSDIDALVSLGAEILCIDVAHGDSQMCIDTCEYISKKHPQVLLIAGNVATGSGAERLWRAGADVVKVGIGPGSLCTTRIETGNGVPQLTALMEVFERRSYLTTEMPRFNLAKAKDRDCLYPFDPPCKEIDRPIGIIADGGIKNAGDIVKALCFADMVMAGNIFAGTIETPGNTLTYDGRLYKEYVGSSTHKDSHVEGVKALVPQKGYASDILVRLLEGLRSGCSYQGCINLQELKENPQFVRITNAGLKESHPHDVTIK